MLLKAQLETSIQITFSSSNKHNIMGWLFFNGVLPVTFAPVCPSETSFTGYLYCRRHSWSAVKGRWWSRQVCLKSERDWLTFRSVCVFVSVWKAAFHTSCCHSYSSYWIMFSLWLPVIITNQLSMAGHWSIYFVAKGHNLWVMACILLMLFGPVEDLEGGGGDGTNWFTETSPLFLHPFFILWAVHGKALSETLI